MDTLETIKHRISANHFDTSKPLSEAEITEFVAYASEAPSSYNIQHWRFIAVTKPEEKARLKAVAYNQPKVADAAVTFIVLGDTLAYERLAQIYQPLVDAGAMPQEMANRVVAMATGAYQNDPQKQRDEAAAAEPGLEQAWFRWQKLAVTRGTLPMSTEPVDSPRTIVDQFI